MGYRRKVLLKLYRLHCTEGPNTALFTRDLPGYSRSKEPKKLIVAINQLLDEGLILGREVNDVPPENHADQSMCFYINTKMLKEVREDLHVWYIDARFINPAVIGLGCRKRIPKPVTVS